MLQSFWTPIGKLLEHSRTRFFRWNVRNSCRVQEYRRAPRPRSRMSKQHDLHNSAGSRRALMFERYGESRRKAFMFLPYRQDARNTEASHFAKNNENVYGIFLDDVPTLSFALMLFVPDVVLEGAAANLEGTKASTEETAAASTAARAMDFIIIVTLKIFLSLRVCVVRMEHFLQMERFATGIFYTTSAQSSVLMCLSSSDVSKNNFWLTLRNRTRCQHSPSFL